MGASMGFFRMQDCRLALSIEEGGDEAAAAFPAPLLRGASPPWLLSRVTLHHWARGVGGEGEEWGQAQSQCRIRTCSALYFLLDF